MKKILGILFIFITAYSYSQQPFYGDRTFVSYDGQDTLYVTFKGDSLELKSTDSIYFVAKYFQFNTGISWNDTTLAVISLNNGVFIGENAGENVTSGTSNTFLGRRSGRTLTTASNNTFIGTEAGYTSNGSSNTAVGSAAGYSLTTGTGNNLIGVQAGVAIEDGIDNIVVGSFSADGLTSGDDNIVIGSGSGTGLTLGNKNILIGSNAGNGITIGIDNVFTGYDAGASATGDRNTSIGTYSGKVATGNNNTFLGYEAGTAITSGAANVFLGMGSGSTNTTGTGNVFVGYLAGSNETGSNKLFIDNSSTSNPLIYGEFNNDIVKINGAFIQASGTIADNDATPDVSAANIWTYNGTANSVTVTDLDNPDAGTIYRIIGNSDTYTISINDSGNFNLSGNWTGGIDDVITIYVQADNDYIELSRTDN